MWPSFGRRPCWAAGSARWAPLQNAHHASPPSQIKPFHPTANACRLNFGLAAAALGHVIMLGPLAAGQGGPLAPVLLAVWALASERGGA